MENKIKELCEYIIKAKIGEKNDFECESIGCSKCVFLNCGICKYVKKEHKELAEKWLQEHSPTEEKTAHKNTEKTFGGLIIGWCNVKPDEIWESENFIISKDVDGDLKIEHKAGLSNCVGIFINPNDVFKLKRKEYTFEEAFNSKGIAKEIESLVSGIKYKKQDENTMMFKDRDMDDFAGISNDNAIFSIDEIQGKWFINN